MPKKHFLSNTYQESIVKIIKEKYTYFLIGLTVVLLISFFLISQFIKTISPKTKKVEKIVQKEKRVEKKLGDEKNKYQVKEGDYLWQIAEQIYGSGFNAYDIAAANNISNPDLIYKDQVIIIPKVTPKQPTKGETTGAATEQVLKTNTKYVVKPGDYLWKIALDFYGDGYMWSRIATANNLVNPNYIEPGSLLTIPR